MNFKNTNYNSLAGKFLIASPIISDPRFAKCLIYMISDDEEGSMGLIVNKPAKNLIVEQICSTNIKEESNITYKPDPTVYYGGPVEIDKGFILHTKDYENTYESTAIKNNLLLSSNIKILKDIMSGKGPSKFFFAMGYAGWDSNQLAKELKVNTWIEANLDVDTVFSKNSEKKWENALLSIGINTKSLSKLNFSPISGSA